VILSSAPARRLSLKSWDGYVGIEIDETYCCLAEKRLETAAVDETIQGYEDGVFWERNSKS
jgi:site-specific DNA-methyltransferase (adenine-specific)